METPENTNHQVKAQILVHFKGYKSLICQYILSKRKKLQCSNFLMVRFIKDYLVAINFQVTVKGYKGNYDTSKDSKFSVPLSTRISELKTMKIFLGGTRHGGDECYPLDKFTLGHEGKELADDVTLHSIYTPGKDLVLQPHTFTNTVKESTGKWEFPVTMKVEDFGSEQRCHQVIKGHIFIHIGISTDRAMTIDYRIVPGLVFNVTLQ